MAPKPCSAVILRDNAVPILSEFQMKCVFSQVIISLGSLDQRKK